MFIKNVLAGAVAAPVPPRATDSVPVQPAVIDTAFISEVAGVPPNVSVTFVSFAAVSAAIALKDGAAAKPVLLLNTVLAPAVAAPVPPRPTASVPLQPNVSDTLFKSAVAGVPVRLSVTLVSSVSVNAPAALNIGGPTVLLRPNQVSALAFERANESAGVVVAVPTLVVNNGERLPALKLVTVPVPAAPHTVS